MQVGLENDANCALWAEAWIGAGKDTKNMAMVTLGSGIGGAVIDDGKILRGSTGMAAEIGHMIMEIDGRMHNGTNVRGVAEEYASAGQFASHF